MSYVRVKTKYQVTLPAVLRHKLGLKEGDTLDAKIQNGAIILTPQEIIKKENKTETNNKILSYIGLAKGLFSTPEEADEFIRNERNLWD